MSNAPTDLSRAGALARDAADPLAHLREQFAIAGDGVVYLDGNSLGRLPRITVETMRDVIERQWGSHLIRGWPDWIGLPLEVGAELASFLGAEAHGQVVVCDSTTVNLYKGRAGRAPGQPEPSPTSSPTTTTSRPTVSCSAEIAASRWAARLRVVRSRTSTPASTTSTVAAEIDGRVGLVSLSQVAYRSGADRPCCARSMTLAHAARGAARCGISRTAAGAIPVDRSGYR